MQRTPLHFSQLAASGGRLEAARMQPAQFWVCILRSAPPPGASREAAFEGRTRSRWNWDG